MTPLIYAHDGVLCNQLCKEWSKVFLYGLRKKKNNFVYSIYFVNKFNRKVINTHNTSSKLLIYSSKKKLTKNNYCHLEMTKTTKKNIKPLMRKPMTLAKSIFAFLIIAAFLRDQLVEARKHHLEVRVGVICETTI